MAVTLNASTTAGLVQTADTSGVLALQSNGTTALSTSGANVTIAGTLTTAAQSIAKASMPTGSVLQVVSNTISSSQATGSTSFVASTLIATITPSSATSKILIFLNGGQKDSSSSGNSIQTAMYRDIASAGYSSLSLMEGFLYNSSNPSGGHTFNYLDSPATTSSISYQPYYRLAGGSASVFFNAGSAVVSLTLMEIAA